MSLIFVLTVANVFLFGVLLIALYMSKKHATRKPDNPGYQPRTDLACGRCGVKFGDYDCQDSCAECDLYLCNNCMAAGCCGHKPARSGIDADCVWGLAAAEARDQR